MFLATLKVKHGFKLKKQLHGCKVKETLKNRSRSKAAKEKTHYNTQSLTIWFHYKKHY